MNSLGSSSKWPSYDSLPSTPSFLLSESEQTEDEADVFSEGEGDGGLTKSLSDRDRLKLSGNFVDFPAYSDQLHLRSKSNQPEHCPETSTHPGSATSPGAATLCSSSATPGDLVFAQKCADLHRFIRPLLDLLHGLKTGRFEKGLSSFQQSVAIDRLQRILGILQRPEMGEKYLQNLLQIETMLKIWFPQEAIQTTTALSHTTTPRLQTHWRQNQLHMPVKKRKLSWPDPDHSGKIPTKPKYRQHGKHGSCQATTLRDTVLIQLPGPPKKTTPAEETVKLPWGSFTAGCEFTKRTGTLSGPPYLYSRNISENLRQPEIPPPSACGSPAAQDSSVSSSDTKLLQTHRSWP